LSNAARAFCTPTGKVSRPAYDLMASPVQVKQGDPSDFQLQLVRDF